MEAPLGQQWQKVGVLERARSRGMNANYRIAVADLIIENPGVVDLDVVPAIVVILSA